jgi:hypothetical protein
MIDKPKRRFSEIKTIRITKIMSDAINKILETDKFRFESKYHGSESLFLRIAISKLIISELNQPSEDKKNV